MKVRKEKTVSDLHAGLRLTAVDAMTQRTRQQPSPLTKSDSPTEQDRCVCRIKFIFVNVDENVDSSLINSLM